MKACMGGVGGLSSPSNAAIASINKSHLLLNSD